MVEIWREVKISGIGSLFVVTIVKKMDGKMMKIYYIVSLVLILEQREEFIVK